MKKKTIYMIIIIVILLNINIFFIGKTQGRIEIENQLYAKVAIVTNVDYASDIVILEDATGNLWTLNECDDWQKGDCVALILNTNNTEKIYDDYIVSARYSSFNTTGFINKK